MPFGRQIEHLFPRSNDRGSIEALRLAEAVQAKGGFPRSNDRGSIEASRTGDTLI